MKDQNLRMTWTTPIRQNSSNEPIKQNQINVFCSALESGKGPLKKLQRLTCIICTFERAAGKFANCIHEVLCSKCAEKLVASSLQMDQAPKCPLNCCTATLSTASDSLYRNFSSETRMKWKAFELKSQVSLLGPTHKCQVPDCPGYLDPIRFYCQICEKEHCGKCKRLSHEGECLRVSANIADLEDLKFCKFCSSKLRKEGGCSKIKCQICGKNVCFECLNEWSVSHHGCAQYGWLKLPYYFFTQLCCSDCTVNRNDEVIFDNTEPQTRQF